eukprot:14252068-Alexandrium_andersonii.AAC.1
MNCTTNGWTECADSASPPAFLLRLRAAAAACDRKRQDMTRERVRHLREKKRERMGGAGGLGFVYRAVRKPPAEVPCFLQDAQGVVHTQPHDLDR